MLVNEIKEEIKSYDKKELTKIILELYKKIPKKVKEDYDIDDFIKNINKDNKVEETKISFKQLQEEIVYFLNCVDAEYYCSPNRVIPKSERSSWRFKVKKFYKELMKIDPTTDNGKVATYLLIELFKRLSTGTNYLLFTSCNTFSALKVSQTDFYDLIIKRIFSNGYTRENIERCVDLLDVYKDPNELSFSLYYLLISSLKTVDNKEQAIDALKKKINYLRERDLKVKDSTTSYYINEDINYCIISISNIYILLSEVDEAINYFHKNYGEDNKDKKEEKLLEILEENDLIDEWIEEYEKNMKKIEFSDYLENKYKEFKNR